MPLQETNKRGDTERRRGTMTMENNWDDAVISQATLDSPEDGRSKGQIISKSF
jgi:hypothetical protein